MENKLINTQENRMKESKYLRLQMLYEIDFDNIRNAVSERNICAGLSLHIEKMMRIYDKQNATCLLRDYYADMEYNRLGNGYLKANIAQSIR